MQWGLIIKTKTPKRTKTDSATRSKKHEGRDIGKLRLEFFYKKWFMGRGRTGKNILYLQRRAKLAMGKHKGFEIPFPK